MVQKVVLIIMYKLLVKTSLTEPIITPLPATGSEINSAHMYQDGLNIHDHLALSSSIYYHVALLSMSCML